MEFHILASGSKGNATLFIAKNHLILVDMGITLKALKSGLSKINKEVKDIEAVLITHEHSDHVGGLDTINELPIYGGEGTLEEEYFNPLKPYTFHSIGGFSVCPLEVSHDANHPYGYIIKDEQETAVYITDTGYISEHNISLCKNADYYIIESNHNVKMLLKTNRPASLKYRIMSEVGHLNNADSACYMCEMIGNNTKEIFLAHLSEEANDPEVAINTYKEVFLKKHKSLKNIKLVCANQHYTVSGGHNEN